MVSADVTVHKTTLLDALYRQHRRALMRLLSRQRIGSEDAAEIVQETYRRLQQVPDVEAIEFPKAYLFRTALNLAHDSRRQQRRWPAHEMIDVDGPNVEIAGEEPGPYRILKGQQELAIVRQALMELSAKCRRAFVMHRFEDATYQEIARDLGVSVSMIEKYISQALAHLKARLAGARALARTVRAVK